VYLLEHRPDLYDGQTVWEALLASASAASLPSFVDTLFANDLRPPVGLIDLRTKDLLALEPAAAVYILSHHPPLLRETDHVRGIYRACRYDCFDALVSRLPDFRRYPALGNYLHTIPHGKFLAMAVKRLASTITKHHVFDILNRGTSACVDDHDLVVEALIRHAGLVSEWFNTNEWKGLVTAAWLRPLMNRLPLSLTRAMNTASWSDADNVRLLQERGMTTADVEKQRSAILPKLSVASAALLLQTGLLAARVVEESELPHWQSLLQAVLSRTGREGVLWEMARDFLERLASFLPMTNRMFDPFVLTSSYKRADLDHKLVHEWVKRLPVRAVLQSALAKLGTPTTNWVLQTLNLPTDPALVLDPNVKFRPPRTWCSSIRTFAAYRCTS
jgi:hypothetical protein